MVTEVYAQNVLHLSFWNISQQCNTNLLQTKLLIRQNRMVPSVAKILIQYYLNIFKFGKDKMWTFPWSNRENVQNFYFSRSECGIVFFGGKITWRSYLLTVWAWEILRTFSFPPKPSSNLPTNLPMTAQPRWSSVAHIMAALSRVGQLVKDYGTWNMPFCAILWHTL